MNSVSRIVRKSLLLLVSFPCLQQRVQDHLLKATLPSGATAVRSLQLPCSSLKQGGATLAGACEVFFPQELELDIRDLMPD